MATMLSIELFLDVSKKRNYLYWTGHIGLGNLVDSIISYQHLNPPSKIDSDF